MHIYGKGNGSPALQAISCTELGGNAQRAFLESIEAYKNFQADAGRYAICLHSRTTEFANPSLIETVHRYRLKMQALTRYDGNTRCGTACTVASRIQQISASDTCIVVSGDGFADALSIVPFACAKHYPVFLASSTELYGCYAYGDADTLSEDLVETAVRAATG